MGEIKLDYDISFTKVKNIFKSIGWIIKKQNFKTLDCYRTKKGYHVVIRVSPRYTQMELLNIQILMSSDKNREGLNFLRYKKYGDMKNHLFWCKAFIRNNKIISHRSRKYMPKLSKQLINLIKDNGVKI